MSGHSKWATIHRKKGLIDAERGKIFQKISKEIQVAAKGTNGDPDTNPGLRMVIEKARSNNMPKDNIQKAIDKAVGANSDVNFESIRYEGYAPHGIAIMIDCLTDNKNRTAMLVRSTLTKRGGNLGTDGSVSYMFKRLGVIEIEANDNFDEIMDIAISADSLDVVDCGDTYVIYTEPENFLNVKASFEESGIKDFLRSEVSYVASNKIALDEEDTEKVMSLIEALEDIDDVSSVYHNLDI
ncbi:MAG: YebC/PmpR family DNA-binding transcriptional regulator [Erysipelotrichaceae bacterium]|nr:YebC/PmpR family DNA-binding transcriptional regulator [Erysipelotrichaceae bacterium]